MFLTKTRQAGPAESLWPQAEKYGAFLLLIRLLRSGHGDLARCYFAPYLKSTACNLSLVPLAGEQGTV